MGTITRQYNYVTNEIILAVRHNANENPLYDLVNGNLDTANIADGAIITVLIADGAITADKLAAGAVTVADGSITSAKIADGTIVNADINASAGIVDTKLAQITTSGKVSTSALTGTYAASNITLADAGGYFTGSPPTVETALQELGIGTTGSTFSFVGYDYDATPTNCSVLVPAGTASSKIIVDLTAYLDITSPANFQDAFLSLTINGTRMANPLANGGASRPEFVVSIGSSSQAVAITSTKHCIIDATSWSGLDLAGTAYTIGIAAIVTDFGVVTASGASLAVYAI